MLVGRLHAALWLWSVVSYDNPEGNAEKEMILQCLGDKNFQTVKKDIAILANAVKANCAGDSAGARKLYRQLGRLSLGEFEFLWNRQGRIFTPMIKKQRWGLLVQDLLEQCAITIVAISSGIYSGLLPLIDNKSSLRQISRAQQDPFPFSNTRLRKRNLTIS